MQAASDVLMPCGDAGALDGGGGGRGHQNCEQCDRVRGRGRILWYGMVRYYPVDTLHQSALGWGPDREDETDGHEELRLQAFFIALAIQMLTVDPGCLVMETYGRDKQGAMGAMAGTEEAQGRRGFGMHTSMVRPCTCSAASRRTRFFS